MSDSKNYLVGFFDVEGRGNISIETPLTGEGQTDYARLWDQVRARYGNVRIERTGSTIEQRAEVEKLVEYPVGGTVQQLFDTMDDCCSILLGRVEFAKFESDIILRYHRGHNIAGVTLIERATRGVTRFSDKIPGGKSSADLPAIIAGIVGYEKLNLRLKEIPADV
jgi:hypothetical protein